MKNAILALTQTSAVNVQADVMGLLRSILLTWLSRSQAVRLLMLSLPNVTEQVRRITWLCSLHRCLLLRAVAQTSLYFCSHQADRRDCPHYGLEYL